MEVEEVFLTASFLLGSWHEHSVVLQVSYHIVFETLQLSRSLSENTILVLQYDVCYLLLPCLKYCLSTCCYFAIAAVVIVVG